jgi:hypothetical protein
MLMDVLRPRHSVASATRPGHGSSNRRYERYLFYLGMVGFGLPCVMVVLGAMAGTDLRASEINTLRLRTGFLIEGPRVMPTSGRLTSVEMPDQAPAEVRLSHDRYEDLVNQLEKLTESGQQVQHETETLIRRLPIARTALETIAKLG